MTRDADAPELLYPVRPRLNDRRLTRGRTFGLRRLTAPFRARPDFLIVGAMKAGTSSLFHYLSQHPLIVAPVRKELHYFTAARRAGMTPDWYRAHFPLKARMGGGRLTGEATPGYMFEEGVAAAIAADLPDVRMIVLLRDPVARAVSHWRHEVAMGRETLPFDTAIAVEDERRARALQAGAAGRETWLHASYKARGIYLPQIEALEAAVGRERILILGSGTLFADPARTTAAALAFLGLPPLTGGFYPRRNASRAGPPVPQGTLSGLSAFFAPHNARLVRHLGFTPEW